MKKKIFVIFISIFLMISSVNAACDNSERNRLKSLSNDITYETSYSISTKTFTIKFYNVFPGLIIGINDGTIKGGDNNDSYSVTIDNIKEGEHLTANIYDSIGCDETLNTLFITLPYYNTFYGTQKCEKYVGKLTQCTYKFLSYELTEDILDGAIKSLDTEIEPIIPESVVKKTFFEKAYETLKTFLTDWGINIGLFLFFGIVTAVIGEKIYRKIKHGI